MRTKGSALLTTKKQETKTKMVFQLPEREFWFPDPLQIPEEEREPDGFYAVGGDLHPKRLIEAYSQGIFPWTAFRDINVNAHERTIYNQLRWYCPMERFVIFPDEVHISHSMRTLLRKGIYKTTIDKDFSGVINNCSKLRIDEEGAWLGPQMIKAYTRLHQIKFAHSVEVWKDDELVGGLYGVGIGCGFMGESMFSLEPSASKVALIHLCKVLAETNVAFVDCQFETPHLRSMGGRYIGYEEYMDLLYQSITKK